MPGSSREQELWAILQIEPTSEIQAIKRAYAKRLKVVRPDGDMHLFQQLRDAYEWALDHGRAAPITAPPTIAQPPATTITEDTTQTPDFRIKRSLPRVQERSIQLSLAEQARLNDEIASLAWQQLIHNCRPAITVIFDAANVNKISAAINTVIDFLGSTLRAPTMEALATRDAFQNLAFSYCADETAAAIVRMACLIVFDWESEQKFLDRQANGVAYRAIQRSFADSQYFSLLRRAVRSEALRDMLRPGSVSIRWYKFYSTEYSNDVRQWVTELSTSLDLAAHFYFDHAALARWSDVVNRPWPGLHGFLCATFGGLIVAVFAVGMISSAPSFNTFAWLRSDIPLLSLGAILLILPALLIAAYPRFMYPYVQPVLLSLQKSQRVHIVVWLAAALLSGAPFFFQQLPVLLQEILMPAACCLIFANLLLEQEQKIGHAVQLGLMGLFVLGPLMHALAPFNDKTLWIFAPLAATLFMQSRYIVSAISAVDLFRPAIRFGMLVTGGLVVIAEYVIAPHSLVIAALLGWIWFLLGAGSADLFLLFMLRSGVGRVRAMLWLIALGLLFMLPQIYRIDSPLQGMLQLQMIVAIAITIGLIESGVARHRKKSAARKTK